MNISKKEFKIKGKRNPIYEDHDIWETEEKRIVQNCHWFARYRFEARPASGVTAGSDGSSTSLLFHEGFTRFDSSDIVKSFSLTSESWW